jgi:hypothetical protein
MRFEQLSKKDQAWARRYKPEHVPGIADAIVGINKRHAAMQRSYVAAVVQAVTAAEEATRASARPAPRRGGRPSPRTRGR